MPPKNSKKRKEEKKSQQKEVSKAAELLSELFIAQINAERLKKNKNKKDFEDKQNEARKT